MADWKDAFDAKTEDTTPDIDADFIWTKDTSAGLIKRVKPRNFLALYALLASPTFTGTPAAPTAGAGTNTTQLATTAFVIAEILARVASLDVMVFKGVIDCSANPNYPAADAGATYRISVAGKIGGASGVNVTAGDMAICIVDSTASGNQATVGAFWDVIEMNLDGAMTTAGGTFTGDIHVPDDAYDATTWNGSDKVATKNAIRDKIEAVVAGAAAVSDTVYGSGWDGDTTNAPSKNAVYDKIETLQPLDADLTAIAALSGTNTLYYRSGANTWGAVTIGSNLTFSGGTLSAASGGTGTGGTGTTLGAVYAMASGLALP
jgi:hypothetical protein